MSQKIQYYAKYCLFYSQYLGLSKNFYSGWFITNLNNKSLRLSVIIQNDNVS